MTTTTPPTAEPDPPTDEAAQHLADLLEACLRAERARPGSAASIVQHAPASLRPELEHLLHLGHALRANRASEATAGELAAVRARLLARLEAEPPG
jgi:hypothetical protein